MRAIIKVLNRKDFSRVDGIISEAYQVNYNLDASSGGTCSFKVNANATNADSLKVLKFIKLYEEGREVGVFRILGLNTEIDGLNVVLTINCEHAINLLLDTIIYGEVDGGEEEQELSKVLLQLEEMQLTKYWKLRTSLPPTYRVYVDWENTNVKNALFSIFKNYEDLGYWRYNTSSFPWTATFETFDKKGPVNILQGDFRSSEFSKSEDVSNLATRLYLLGGGEGEEQIDISEANPTKKPFLERNTDKYGVIEKMIVDRRFKYSKSLYDYGRHLISKMSEPVVEYNINVANGSLSRGKSGLDDISIGERVYVYDRNNKLETEAFVISISKNSIESVAGFTSITISQNVDSLFENSFEIMEKVIVNERTTQSNKFSLTERKSTKRGQVAYLNIPLPKDIIRATNAVSRVYIPTSKGQWGSDVSLYTVIKAIDKNGKTVRDAGIKHFKRINPFVVEYDYSRWLRQEGGNPVVIEMDITLSDRDPNVPNIGEPFDVLGVVNGSVKAETKEYQKYE